VTRYYTFRSEYDADPSLWLIIAGSVAFNAVNNLRTLGRWAFAELTEIYQIDADFKAKV